jgi:hypothetical protein
LERKSSLGEENESQLSLMQARLEALTVRNKEASAAHEQELEEVREWLSLCRGSE